MLLHCKYYIVTKDSVISWLIDCCHQVGVNNELSIKNESMVEDVMADAETEEALAEFDFLVSESGEGAGEARSQGDGTDWGKEEDLLTLV